MRIIKRYPNRRLYDTEASCYVSIDEIKNLVLNHTAFKIIDNKTNEDLTNYILLQIISEQEQQKFPIFTKALLENIIRFYGNPLQKKMSEFLEMCFNRFDAKSEDQSVFNSFFQLAQQNFEFWQNTFSTSHHQTKKSKTTKSDPT